MPRCGWASERLSLSTIFSESNFPSEVDTQLIIHSIQILSNDSFSPVEQEDIIVPIMCPWPGIYCDLWDKSPRHLPSALSSATTHTHTQVLSLIALGLPGQSQQPASAS